MTVKLSNAKFGGILRTSDINQGVLKLLKHQCNPDSEMFQPSVGQDD